MIVEIHVASALYATLPDVEEKPKIDRWWKLPEGTDIQQILRMLNLDHTPTMIMLNNRQGNRNAVLYDGDILKIFGVPSGG